MEFLDEATVTVEHKISSPGSQDKEHVSPQVAINQADNRIGFLRHFDKSENQLINISSELLAISIKLAQLPEPEDIGEFRRQLIIKLNKVKTSAAQLAYPVAIIDKLCFLFAVVLDEFILYSDWGEKQGWENKTLLSELFGMRNGGELFYTVAEKSIRQPAKLIDLIEVIYIFINIGFKGQYRCQDTDKLTLLTYELERILQQHRPNAALHCKTQVQQPKTRIPARRKRYLALTLTFLLLITMSWGVTQFWYNKTHLQRARDFDALYSYSHKYIISGQQNDVIYLSTDKDMQGGTVNAPNIQNSPSANWIIQLATFDNKSNAESFLNALSASSYQARVNAYKKYYRVIVRSASLAEAKLIKQHYKQQDNINALIIKSNVEAEKV